MDKGLSFLATINTLYNEEIREEYPQIKGFEHWDEVPRLVREANGALALA